MRRGRFGLPSDSAMNRLLLLAWVAVGCSPAAELYVAEDALALGVEAEAWPAEVDRGDVIDVQLSVVNRGDRAFSLAFGADAVRFRATPRAELDAPDGRDLDFATGVRWLPSFTSSPVEVIAVGYRATVEPGGRADLPGSRVPVTLAAGLYTVSACARLRTAETASASEWCTDGVALRIR